MLTKDELMIIAYDIGTLEGLLAASENRSAAAIANGAFERLWQALEKLAKEGE